MVNKLLLFGRWIVILGIPVVLVLTSARSLVARWYPYYEYSKPDFPLDPYGFSQRQRLDLARVAIDYLNTPGRAVEHIDMLIDQRLPYTTQPLYTPPEISHMVDVKNFTDRLWQVYTGSVLLVGGSLIILFIRRSTRAAAAKALFVGGLLTIAIPLALLLFVLLSWSVFFTRFHQLFFPPGSWTFDRSSSLIRLFPERLWLDGGVLLTGVALIAGLAATVTGHILRVRVTRNGTWGD